MIITLELGGWRCKQIVLLLLAIGLHCGVC